MIQWACLSPNEIQDIIPEKIKNSFFQNFSLIHAFK
jgi:hypothetical protein